MRCVERSVLLRYSVQDMYALVRDIEAYPRFLPGCVTAKVEHDEGARVRARLGFRVKGLSDTFATENRLDGNRIEMRLLEGPFRELSGHWDFVALSERGCKVGLQISVDFGSRLLETTLSPFIDRAIGDVMDAFRRRAGALYGSV